MFKTAILGIAVLTWMPAARAATRVGSLPYTSAAAWSQSDGQDYEIYLATASGRSWSAPSRLTDNDERDVVPHMAMAPDGALWVVWTRGTGAERSIRSVRIQNGSWSSPELLPSPCQLNTAPCVGVDAEGNAWAVFSGYDGDSDDIYACRYTEDGWESLGRIHHANAVPDITPSLGVTASGVLTVTWKRYVPNQGYVTFQALRNGGGWDEPEQVEAESQSDDLKAQVATVAAHAPFRTVSLDPVVLLNTQGNPVCVRMRSLLSSSSVKPLPAKKASRRKKTRWRRKVSLREIIAYGDSITQGYPYLQSPGNGTWFGGYEWILAWILKKKGSPASVLNHGWGGEDTAVGLSRLPLVLSYEPGADQVLIMEGTNDEWNGVSFQTTLHNLEAMLDVCLNAGVEPVISTLLPASRDPEHDIENFLNPGIRTMAANKGVRLCNPHDIFAHYASVLFVDGLHPNWLGYIVLAREWSNVLVP